MSRTVFFLRAYNDIDHMAPLIWKFLREGERPILVFYTDVDWENDYRIRFILSEGSPEIHALPDRAYIDYGQKSRKGRLMGRLGRAWYQRKRSRTSRIGRFYREHIETVDCRAEIDFLESRDVGQCVFEWSTPYTRGERIERFFKAATGIGVTTYCLPHGCNMFTHSDVNSGYRDSVLKGVIPDQSGRREFDYYVLQNPLRRDGWVKWGLDPSRTFAWGSTRFCPEWQKINQRIAPAFSPSKDPGERLRVVFMQYQSAYNLRLDAIWELLDALAGDDRIHLVVKGNTREGTGYSSSRFWERHRDSERLEFVGAEAHSPSLIAWSDCVVSFGSSIGMEALLQDKPLINPHYLLSNRTLYERTGAALNAGAKEEVMEHLDRLVENPSHDIPAENREEIFRETIYGGREPHDVLQSYYDKVTAPYLLY